MIVVMTVLIIVVKIVQFIFKMIVLMIVAMIVLMIVAIIVLMIVVMIVLMTMRVGDIYPLLRYFSCTPLNSLQPPFKPRKPSCLPLSSIPFLLLYPVVSQPLLY